MVVRSHMSAATWLRSQIIEHLDLEHAIKIFSLYPYKKNGSFSLWLLDQPEVAAIAGIKQEYQSRRNADILVALSRRRADLAAWQSQLEIEQDAHRRLNIEKAINRCQSYIDLHSHLEKMKDSLNAE